MSPGRGRRASSVGVWLLLAAVLAAALAFGAHRGGGTSTAAQRAAAIDAVLKCPSCDGISVADSSASTAAAVRQVVLARVRAGQSAPQIEAYLVSRYGPSILLRPPTSGITAVVWIVPLVAGAGGLAGLGLFFWRRRRPAGAVPTAEDRALVDRALAELGDGTGDESPQGS